MQGVSRGSLAAVREKLDSVLAGGAKKDAAAKQQVAEELFAVVALLDGNAQLRRMLSDPAVDADRRERAGRRPVRRTAVRADVARS